jgi:hypothetical protein
MNTYDGQLYSNFDAYEAWDSFWTGPMDINQM